MWVPAKYRAQAAECVRQAQNAYNPDDRMVLLEMGRIWLGMANEADLNYKSSRDDPSKTFLSLPG